MCARPGPVKGLTSVLCPSDGSEGGRVSRTVLERWRESLQSCTSLSQVSPPPKLCSDWLMAHQHTHTLHSAQVFVHLSSLERSVLWSRSVLNARCRICRRKGDADNMLLCDGCDRGHHTHCLRPRLKVRVTPRTGCLEAELLWWCVNPVRSVLGD